MRRTLAHDWYEGAIPDNVQVDEQAYVETAYSFVRCRSQAAAAVVFERGAHSYIGTMFDVGPRGTVHLGEHALLVGARIICDSRVSIGDCAMLSWNVVVMDSYRAPHSPELRRRLLRSVTGSDPGIPELGGDARPVIIGPNVWVGFDACVLPGVTIGPGAVVGAKSVVFESVPPYAVVAGNPARVIRTLEAAV